MTAPGLTDNGSGRYRWDLNQVSGNTAKLDFEIITERDSVLQDSKKYYIKASPKLITTVNDRGCDKCIVELTKKDIKEAKISARTESYFDSRLQNFFILEYTLVFPEGHEYKIYQNKFSDSAQKMIVQYPEGAILK